MTAPKRGARYTVSEKVLEQRRKAARGGKSGRPPKRFKNKPGTPLGERDAALMRGKAALTECVDLWVTLVRIGLAYVKGERREGMSRKGKSRVFHIPEEYAGPILRASENLANRCGLPTLTENTVKTETPPKMIGETKAGYRDNATGEWHDIDPEGAPEGTH